MLLDHLLFFQEGFMADLCPNLPQPRPWTPLWKICSLHCNLQIDNFVARKQKARIGFFIEGHLLKIWMVAWSYFLTENTKPVLVLSVSIFIRAGGYSHKCVTRASFSSLSWKLVCDQGNCSFVFVTGMVLTLPYFFILKIKTSCLDQRLFIVLKDKDALTFRGTV